MKKLYIAEWPNGTVTIVSARSMLDLFWNLDVVGDPYGASKITEVAFREEIFIDVKLGLENNEEKWSLEDSDCRERVIQSDSICAFEPVEEIYRKTYGEFSFDEVEYDQKQHQ
jgi:hypothetical protein